MVGHFGVCTPVELNLITNVLFSYIVLKHWFSPKTIDCNCKKEVTVLLLISPDCGGPEALDNLDMVGRFGFCTHVELNLITKVLLYHTVLRFWFSPKKIACNCDARLLFS